MSFRLPPGDARRGGLVILGARGDTGAELARLYADGGYETIVAEEADDAGSLIESLTPPVFVFALPDAAAVAWRLGGIAAVSLVGDQAIAAVSAHAPTAPAILHLGPASHDRLAETLEAALPDLPVHLRLETPDGERLLFLRTLRLFSTHAGGRGEV